MRARQPLGSQGLRQHRPLFQHPSSSPGDAALRAGRVSYMRTATTRPEAAVSAATTQIAAWIPNASAVTPALSLIHI